jgi:hypothetical protein
MLISDSSIIFETLIWLLKIRVARSSFTRASTACISSGNNLVGVYIAAAPRSDEDTRCVLRL